MSRSNLLVSLRELLEWTLLNDTCLFHRVDTGLTESFNAEILSPSPAAERRKCGTYNVSLSKRTEIISVRNGISIFFSRLEIWKQP